MRGKCFPLGVVAEDLDVDKASDVELLRPEHRHLGGDEVGNEEAVGLDNFWSLRGFGAREFWACVLLASKELAAEIRSGSF